MKTPMACMSCGLPEEHGRCKVCDMVVVTVTDPTTDSVAPPTPPVLNLHRFAVVETCTALRDAIVGSYGLSSEEFMERYTWLKWRVNHWSPTTTARSQTYDAAIRSLAWATIEMCGL